jgi:hypothetical protein
MATNSPAAEARDFHAAARITYARTFRPPRKSVSDPTRYRVRIATPAQSVSGRDSLCNRMI